MLNRTIIINSNSKPESLHVVMHEGVIIDPIPSQAFLFGGLNMGKFKRTIGPLCACGCGKRVTWAYWRNEWNKFLSQHHSRGRNFKERPSDSEAPLCACGCKEKVKWNKYKNQWNKYLYTHQCKGKNNPRYGEDKHKKEKDKSAPICECGLCNKKTKFNRCTGKYNRFVDGHESRGKHNGNWQGGVTAEPYCDVWLDKEYKKNIKDRDNNKCQNPDCWGKCNHLPLTIHHIDYIKKNCHPWNLITLCTSCNSRANKNRKQHQLLYRSIMTEKYGYSYQSLD